MKALVIGCREGNIGNGIAHEINRLYGMEVHSTDRDQLDVRSAYGVHNWFATKGPYAHVVYSAGIQTVEMIPDMQVDSMQDIFDVNVMGFLRVLRSYSRTQKSGNVLAVVSDASHTPMRGSINYCASKAALAMAVRCGARELSPTFRVNGISPTVVEGTPMTDYIDETVPHLRGWSEEQARLYEKSMIPMGRRVKVQEVVQLSMDILFGGPMLTGSVINMTGGK